MWLGMPGWPDGGCAAGLGGLVCGYGAAWGAVPGPPALPSFQAGSSSRQPSSELAEGRGLLTLTNGFHPRRRRALPLAAGVCPRQSCGLRSHLLARVKAPGSDVSVPGDAAGNDRVDLADQRRGDRGAGLLAGELVFGAAGQRFERVTMQRGNPLGILVKLPAGFRQQDARAVAICHATRSQATGAVKIAGVVR